MDGAVALFYAKIDQKKNILETFDDVAWPHGCHTAKFASGMVMTDVIHDRGCYYNEYL